MPFQPLDPQTNLDPFTVVSFTGIDAQTGFFLDADGVNSSLLVKTSDTPAMYVDAYQNVGINTLSPTAQLDVNAANGECLKLTYNSTSNKGALGVSSDGKLLVSASGSEVVVDAANDLNIKSHNGSTTGLRLNNTLLRSSADQLNYNIVTPGTATASKTVVLDSSKSITGITALSADQLTGTIQTAAQPNIESVTVLDITGHNGVEGLSLDGTLVTSSAEKLNYVDITTTGTAQASKALVVDSNRDITLIRNLTASQLTGTLQTAAQPNITSVGTLSSLDISGSLSGVSRLSLATSEVGRTLVVNSEDGNSIRMYYDADTSTTNYTDLLVSASGNLSIIPSGGDVDLVGHNGTNGLRLDGTLVTASADQINYLADTNVGQAVGGKALIVDSSRNISNINNLTASNLTGTLQTAAQPNISSVNVLNVSNHNGSTTGLALNGTLVTATAAELNYVDTTVGSTTASKALVVDANKDITGINALSANELTGTLQTAAQPNVTSVGTLSNIATSGTVTVGSTVISETDIAKIDAITNGTAAADKALVLDGSKTIVGITALSADDLTGTLQTSYQPNVTQVDTLDIAGHDGSTQGLTLDNELVTATAAQLNYTNVAQGTATASKALVLNSSKTITGITALSADELTGELQTNAQPNITSVGELTSLDVTNDATVGGKLTVTGDLECDGNLIVGGTIISESEIVHLDGATPGTAEALKAMITDSNNSIGSVNNIGTTTITVGATVINETDIAKIDAITNGTAAANKAIVLDGSLNISGINAISSSTITLGSTVINETDIAKIDAITNGTAAANKAIVLDGSLDIASINSLSATSLTGTLQTSYQPNVTSVDVLDIADHDGATVGLKLGGVLLTATAAQLNAIFGAGGSGTFTTLTVTTDLDISGHDGATQGLSLDGTLVTTTATELNYLDGSTPGTAVAGKALVLDGSSDITGINVLSASELYGELQTSFQPNITTVNVLNIDDHNGSTIGLSLGGTLVTSTANELNYVDVTAGSAAASKALVLDSNSDITGINALSASSITGQLQTASQPNITSVGTLTSVTTSGNLTLGSTVISETDIAKIDSIVNGTASASKAIVLDSSKNISGLNNVSAATLLLGTPANNELNLEIGASSYNVNFAYAYNNESNAHGLVDAGSNQSLAISARMDGRLIVTGETMITSDVRLKKNIENIDSALAKSFIMKTTPVTFNWKHNDTMLEYGYIAQEVCKAGFTDLVTNVPDVGLTKLVDEDGFESPADTRLVFTAGKIIPLLALNQKNMYQELEEKDKRIQELEDRIAKIEELLKQ